VPAIAFLFARGEARSCPRLHSFFARGEARGWTFQLCSRLHFLLVVRRTSFMGSTGEMLLFVFYVVNLFTLFLFSVFSFCFHLFILFFISST